MINDVLLNMAANLAYDLLKVSAGRLREIAFGTDQQRALRHVYQRAFEAMLTQMTADLAVDSHDLLQQFVSQNDVANYLLDVALKGRELPRIELRILFETLGFAATTLSVDFDAAMTSFAQALTEALRDEAAELDSPLYHRVSLGLLGALDAGQQEQRTLLEQVLAGQNEAKCQLERVISYMEKLEDYRRLITALVQASGDRAVAVGGDVSGSIIVIGDRNIVLADGGRLAREWESADLDPAVLLPQYLKRVAEVYAPLSFPLGYLSKPILLDEVYLSLPIIKPITEEALLLPTRSGRPLIGTPIRGTDELLKQNERAALVGSLGAGKTTTLRYLAWVYARRPEHRHYWGDGRLVPFYVRIRDLAELWPRSKNKAGEDPLIECLAETVSIALRRTFPARNVERILRHTLADGNALILLDALDEFRSSEKERSDFVEALQTQADVVFRKNHFLLTSRPYRFLNPRGFGQYGLQDVQETERLVFQLGRAMLKTRFETITEEQIRSWLRTLSGTITSFQWREFSSPLYITLMVYLGTSKASPEEGVAFLKGINGLADPYRRFLTETLKWEAKRGHDPQAEEYETLLVLAWAAYYTFVERNVERKGNLLLLPEWIAQATKSGPKEVSRLLEFWHETGLLYKDESRSQWAFQHSGFQAFGVAHALLHMMLYSQKEAVDRLWRDHRWDPEWETIWQLFTSLRAGQTL